jgi:hypothetical protein
VSGVITSIPPKRVALRGNISTVPIAIASPSEATAEQIPAVVDAPFALSVGFAVETVAVDFTRPLTSPIERTASAVITTIVSGNASFSSSR